MCVRGKQRKDEISVDSLDFSKKILHTAWYLSENIVAVVATNNLYILQDKVTRRTRYYLIISHTISQTLVKIYFIFFGRTACGILVTRPGIKPMYPAVESQSLNHWTAREVPQTRFLNVSLGVHWMHRP